MAALLCLPLGLTAAALASSVERGATYSGATDHGQVAVTFAVAPSGRTVTASARYAPLYCRGKPGVERAATRPALIEGGYFRATISYELVPSHTITAQLLLMGRIDGATARGVARSIFPHSASCSGATTFSAQAR